MTITIIVFKFCVIGGIFLFWFFGALFFTMFIKEEYGEGVDRIEDLIERDMSLGKYLIFILLCVICPEVPWSINYFSSHALRMGKSC